MKPKATISVARDYSTLPAGRDGDDGPYSGERFRREFLMPAFREYDKVVVILDGAEGYGSSFLDEAFGGLVRVEKMKPDELRRRLEIVSDDDESFRDEAWEYIDFNAGAAAP